MPTMLFRGKHNTVALPDVAYVNSLDPGDPSKGMRVYLVHPDLVGEARLCIHLDAEDGARFLGEWDAYHVRIAPSYPNRGCWWVLTSGGPSPNRPYARVLMSPEAAAAHNRAAEWMNLGMRWMVEGGTE